MDSNISRAAFLELLNRMELCQATKNNVNLIYDSHFFVKCTILYRILIAQSLYEGSLNPSSHSGMTILIDNGTKCASKNELPLNTRGRGREGPF